MRVGGRQDRWTVRAARVKGSEEEATARVRGNGKKAIAKVRFRV